LKQVFDFLPAFRGHKEESGVYIRESEQRLVFDSGL